jgi:DNA replication protein DnaC
MVRRANIPPLYEHCDFRSFDATYPGADRSLQDALLTSHRFVEEYPLETRGLLLGGTIGSGKTHLAVAALRGVIVERGAQGLFCDYRDLLRNIQNSYNQQSNATETQILDPVINAQVLVIDDLGAIRPSEWVWDTVSVVLNSRYNNRYTTIITTNYPVELVGKGSLSAIERATRGETLGDRIGDRMVSRLVDMCQCVRITGVDFRMSPPTSRR